MLSKIRNAIPPGNRKYPLKYYRMVNCIMDHMSLARNRYVLAHAIQTPGMELLRFLILNIPLEDLDHMESDIDRYTEIFKFYKNSFLVAFDPVASGSIEGGKWVKKEGTDTPVEVILNCDLDQPLAIYPFDKPWMEWQDIRSVRILYHDSVELPEDFASSQFVFTKKKPEAIIVAIDATTLVFKYYKYLQDCRASNMEPDANFFLKQYEYLYFFDDLYEIFTTNLLMEVFKDPNKPAKDIAETMVVPRRFAGQATVEMGIQGIKDQINLLKTNAMKPGDFMEIRWWLGGSIKEKMAYLDNFVTLPPQYQYRWIETLKWLPYLKLIIEAVRLFPEGAQQKTIMNKANEIFVQKFKYISLPSVAHSAKLRTFIDKIADEVEGLLT